MRDFRVAHRHGLRRCALALGLCLTLQPFIAAVYPVAAAARWSARATVLSPNERRHRPTGLITLTGASAPTPAARPQATPTPAASPTPEVKPGTEHLQYPLPDLKPLGNAGSKTVKPIDPATDEFIPLPDRWRFGWPRYDRYADKHETPWITGSELDPYNQNILKSDYPIFGNHTFLNLNLQSATNFNPREVAVNGRREQFFTNQNFVFGAEIFRGTGAFEPKRFAIRATTVLNFNFLANNSLNLFNSKRGRIRFTVEEGFVEKRLAVLSPNFDFMSVRVGMQNFTSDFRGFLFTDNQLGVRLFGNAHSNRDQYNVAFFPMVQRDEVSQLHIFKNRHENVLIANWFRQDFIKKGYTGLFSFAFNNDRGFTPGDAHHPLNVAYFGYHGDGRLGTWNIDHSFYEAVGTDTFNRLAQRNVSINAQMAAVELSKDRDWIRFRGSFFFASGDKDVNDDHANGFDMITDNPNFAGGQFMFWTQQATNVGGRIGTLTNKFSLLPDLRDKFTQRANFVNPGIWLASGGMDFRLTPKIKLISNISYLSFARSHILQQLTGNPNITNPIGVDLSMATKWRPFENENMFFVFGAAMLVPRGGYAQLIGSRSVLVSPTFAINLAF